MCYALIVWRLRLEIWCRSTMWGLATPVSRAINATGLAIEDCTQQIGRSCGIGKIADNARANSRYNARQARGYSGRVRTRASIGLAPTHSPGQGGASKD